jgi:hypothetical protein
MKINSRLLLSELCAAGAAACCTAVLVVGCATGERTGRFWNPGDVSSSDAYAQAELARDHAVAANLNSPPGAPAKVSPASGTQDGSNGRVTIPDQADSPPPPLTTPESPTTATLPPPDPVVAKVDGATGAVQATGVAAGSAQLTGSDIPGTVVAPYVQKVAPSGGVDNSRHDAEIVKPKQVFAQQLDPFAATDAKPFATPLDAGTLEATPAMAPSVAPTNSFPTTAVASTHSAPADVPPPVPTGATLPPSEVSPPPTVSTGVPTGDSTSAPPPAVAVPAAIPSTITAAPAAPFVTVPTAAVPTAAAPAAVVTPPPSVAPASAPPAAAEQFDPTLASEPTAVPATTAEPAASESSPKSVAPEAPVADPLASSSAPPMELESPGEPTVVVPMRPHPGASPADENLTEAGAARHAAERQPVVEPAGSQATDQAQASAPAHSYEAEGHPDASGRPCVTPPSPPASPAANTTAPPQPKPAPDTWESTKSSAPAVSPRDKTAAASLSAPGSRLPAESLASPAVVAAPDAELRRALPPTAASEQAKAGEPAAMNVVSDPMICDSGSIHGRYTGDDLPAASVPQPVARRAPAGPPPARVGHPAAKSSDHATEGKSTSFWDDAWSAPGGNHTVATADFSVPAPPPPEELPSSDPQANAVAVSSKLALAVTGGNAGLLASRAWFAIGLVAGLVLSAVVWRRWRRGDEPQAG